MAFVDGLGMRVDWRCRGCFAWRLWFFSVAVAAKGGGVSYDRFPGHCARYRGCGGALMALTRTEMWEAQVVARERMGLPVLEVIPAAIRARALLEVLEVLRLGLA